MPTLRVYASIILSSASSASSSTFFFVTFAGRFGYSRGGLLINYWSTCSS